jgi:hypothetical protein
MIVDGVAYSHIFVPQRTKNETKKETETLSCKNHFMKMKKEVRMEWECGQRLLELLFWLHCFGYYPKALPRAVALGEWPALRFQWKETRIGT